MFTTLEKELIAGLVLSFMQDVHTVPEQLKEKLITLDDDFNNSAINDLVNSDDDYTNDINQIMESVVDKLLGE